MRRAAGWRGAGRRGGAGAGCQGAAGQSLNARRRTSRRTGGHSARGERDDGGPRHPHLGADGLSAGAAPGVRAGRGAGVPVGRAVAARQLAELDVAPLPSEEPLARYVEQVGQYVALVAEATGNASAPDRAQPGRARAAQPPLAPHGLPLPGAAGGGAPRDARAPAAPSWCPRASCATLQTEEELGGGARPRGGARAARPRRGGAQGVHVPARGAKDEPPRR